MESSAKDHSRKLRVAQEEHKTDNTYIHDLFIKINYS